MFRTAYAYHGKITHVLKCDDDSYVYVGKLLDYLAALPQSHTWIGRKQQYDKPTDNTTSKWYVPPALRHPSAQGVGYMNGGPGYIVTADLAELLVTGTVASCTPERFYSLEDVAMGQWMACLSKQGVLPPGTNITMAGEGNYFYFYCQDDSIIAHKIAPKRMHCIYEAGGGCCKNTTKASQMRHPTTVGGN